MKRILHISLMLALLLVSIYSCKKEFSLENAKKGTSSSGSLQADQTGDCLPKTLQGAFIAGKALTSGNYIQVDVDVDVKGTYRISTDTVNGYYFSASGEFANTGINTINLTGTGKPLAQGDDVFTVYFDSTYCNFEVSVLPASAGAPAAFTLGNCANILPNGSYTKGVALNSNNKLDVEVNVTSIGSYSISTTATDGMTFSGSGAFTTTGAQTITLSGSGTPVNGGAITIPITVGSSSCNATINVGNTTTPPTGAYFWKFTADSITYQGTIDSTDAQLSITTSGGFTVNTLIFGGANAAGDTSISVVLSDASGGINANETYSSSSLTTNPLLFSLDAGSNTYDANFQVAGSNLTLKIIGHNTGTQVIDGTFSGTVKNDAGVSKTITNGQFKFKYQKV